jgi:16S rRNA (cytidine1402-2'-O)-methyltransferase
LSRVTLIAAEDTRQTHTLLDHFGIRTRLVSLHDHNESAVSRQLVESVLQGGSLALVSDAGTPLVSDPGYSLIAMAHDLGVRVVPVPGPSALIAALCVGGLACDRFVFEGFLPARQAARMLALAQSRSEPRTLVYYESPHRIVDTLRAMTSLFPERRMTLARELTKRFETVRRGPVAEISRWVESDVNQQRGEFVLLLEGAAPEALSLESVRPKLERMLKDLPPKKAVNLAAELFQINKKELYRLTLELKDSEH